MEKVNKKISPTNRSELVTGDIPAEAETQSDFLWLNDGTGQYHNLLLANHTTKYLHTIFIASWKTCC